MAATLREAVGASVGYRVRFGSKVSAATRIEVVTEGVFTRLVLDDPSLAGVAAVLFDEFHLGATWAGAPSRHPPFEV